MILATKLAISGSPKLTLTVGTWEQSVQRSRNCKENQKRPGLACRLIVPSHPCGSDMDKEEFLVHANV
jgi:hypothetical protein